MKNANDDDDSPFTCSKCGKCLENGYSMACFHMLCRECFDVQDDATSSHTCDICHVSYNKNSITSIDNLIRWNIDKLKKKIKCTGCSENLPAVYHCQQCNDDLCQNCASAHGRVKFTKDHQLIQHEKSPNNFCSLHRNSKADFFCLTCESNFCIFCFLLDKHPANGDHRFCTDLQPATLEKLKKLQDNTSLVHMVQTLNVEKTKIVQNLEEIDQIERDWRTELESTLVLIQILCQSRRNPLVEAKKNAEVAERMMVKMPSFVVNNLALSNDESFSEIEHLFIKSNRLLSQLAESILEKSKIFEQSKTDALPAPNFSTFHQFRLMLQGKIECKNGATLPPQVTVPLLPGIFSSPPNVQYAASPGELSCAVGSSPACHEVPNPQLYSPISQTMPSNAFYPSPRGRYDPGVYCDQFGAHCSNMQGTQMRPFLNQAFPNFAPPPVIRPPKTRDFSGHTAPGHLPNSPLMPHLTPAYEPQTAASLWHLQRINEQVQRFSTTAGNLPPPPENQVKKRKSGAGVDGQTNIRKRRKKSIPNNMDSPIDASTKQGKANGNVRSTLNTVSDSRQYANFSTSPCDYGDNRLVICETPPMGLL